MIATRLIRTLALFPGQRGDVVPLGDQRFFVLAVVQAQLGAGLVFHERLFVLAFDQQRGEPDAVVEGGVGPGGLGIFERTGAHATVDQGFVEGCPGVRAGSAGLSSGGG